MHFFAIINEFSIIDDQFFTSAKTTRVRVLEGLELVRFAHIRIIKRICSYSAIYYMKS